MAQQIDVPGMGIVEFPDDMNDDQISAAIKQNMAPTQKKEDRSSVLAPINAVAELGARGIDRIAQGVFGAPPRQDQPLQPFGIGGWQPSAVGMAKDLAGTVQSGVTLPQDVYTGKVDPLSEEGIRRAYDLASVTPLSTLPTAGMRSATAALKSEPIKDAAEASYAAVRDRARDIPLQKEYSEALSDHIRAVVSDRGPRAKAAPLAHKEIDDLAKAKDLGDLVESRAALTRIIREESGPDVKAAKVALNNLEFAMDRQVPQISGILKTADRDLAIQYRASKLENAISDAVEKQGNRGTGGNVGNAIRQTVEPLTLSKAKNVSDDVLAAAKDVTRPGIGMQALRVLSAFDPTHSKLMAALTMKGMNPLTVPTAVMGAASRQMYDRILQRRARAVAEAMRAEAPATLAQAGYRPRGIISMPGATGANAGILGSLQSEAPLRITVHPSDAM